MTEESKLVMDQATARERDALLKDTVRKLETAEETFRKMNPQRKDMQLTVWSTMNL